MTVMIKRMEKTNFIERKQDDKDQRISRIYITEKGKNICEQLIEIHQGMEAECFKTSLQMRR